MAERPSVEEANELPIDELAMRILRFFENLDDHDNWISLRTAIHSARWTASWSARTSTSRKFVLERGHLWGRKEVTIPIGAIARVESDPVHVALSKDEVGALPAVRVGRHG